MSKAYFKKYFELPALVLVMLAVLQPAPQTAQAAAVAARGALVRPAVFEGQHMQLPGFQLGFEVITEGTANYSRERTMRAAFPFDTDLTIIGAWGYTGDKFTVKITDLGDTGDRLFACAIAVVNGRSTTEWGTMYSSGTQNSFEVTVPMESPGGIVYLLTGYFTPSLGDDQPFGYTIAFSFPQ